MASPIPCTEGLCVTFSPNPADPEGAVTLDWNAPQASRVALIWTDATLAAQELPNLPTAGDRTLDLAQVYFGGTIAHFHFDAYTQAGDRIAYDDIDVPLKTSLSIKMLTISPTEIAPGAAFTLTWEVLAAERVTLTRLDSWGRMTLDTRTLPLSGSMAIPIDPASRNVAQFMLYASRGRLSVGQTVGVKLTCPDHWFFANPPALCPGPASTTRLVEQHFQHGVMLWRADGRVGQIYVFYDTNDGELFADTWQAGMPEADPALTPPAGLYQPVRGFGKVWREAVSIHHSGQVLRDVLGWATEPEFALNGAVQCDTRPKYGDCYLGDPAGAVYVAGMSSGFHLWTGPTPTP